MTRAFNHGAAAYSAVFGIGYMGYMLMPALLAAMISQLGINEAQAGVAATVLLGALATSLFIATPMLTRQRIRQFCLLGALAASSGFAVAAAFDGYGAVIAGLAVAGAGMGLSLAGGDALVSASGNPDRLFAWIFALGQASAIVLLITLLPAAINHFGYQGGFGIIAAWILLMGVLLLFTAPRNVADIDKQQHGQPGLQVFLSTAVFALLMLGLADASVWPFSQQIGQSLGLGSGTAEAVLGAALAAGVLGSVTAAWLGLRLGRVLPMTTGILFLALLYFLILNAPGAEIYAAAQVAVLFFYGFSVPYFFGLCGKLDSSGQYMAAAAGMQMVGLALAPWLAGRLIVSSGYPALGVAVVLAVLAALMLGVIAIRRGR